MAMHTALAAFATHDWVGIFTDSIFSLRAIRHIYTSPGTREPQYYHHHMLLIDGITDLLQERRMKGFITTLPKIRAHTNIWGNYLADAAAKLAVTHYDSLPETQKLKMAIGETAPRSPH